MSTMAVATMTKMMESLPETQQNQVLDHLIPSILRSILNVLASKNISGPSAQQKGFERLEFLRMMS